MEMLVMLGPIVTRIEWLDAAIAWFLSMKFWIGAAVVWLFSAWCIVGAIIEIVRGKSKFFSHDVLVAVLLHGSTAIVALWLASLARGGA